MDRLDSRVTTDEMVRVFMESEASLRDTPGVQFPESHARELMRALADADGKVRVRDALTIRDWYIESLTRVALLGVAMNGEVKLSVNRQGEVAFKYAKHAADDSSFVCAFCENEGSTCGVGSRRTSDA